MKRGVPLLIKKIRDLSVLIPARNEEFLTYTIDNVLANKRANTEIIVVLDGQWPVAPIPDHQDVKIIYHSESIGQRAATNEAAKLSQAKYIMKLDAHCAVDRGFDKKLIADCEYDWTMIPRMYNLHAFDWKCKKCGEQTYQGPKPDKCKCGHAVLEKAMIWKPRRNRRSDSMRFDTDMHFQYWREFGKRSEVRDEKIHPLLCAIGACWFMHRQRFWDIDGLDEKHGSWGQMGVEIACKSWLSGGQHLITKKTWFSHMFRTNKGFGFPYKISGKQVRKARKHSNDIWKNGKWPKAVHDLDWLLEKFKPVPDWHDSKAKSNGHKKGIVYYTENQVEERIYIVARKLIKKVDIPIVSVSHYPIDFGKNIVMDLKRGHVAMFKQILKGLEKSKADIVYLAEHDVLYDKSHFDFIPPDDKYFYYNTNRWAVDSKTGKAVSYKTYCPSHLVAYRSLLLDYYRKRVAIIEKEGFSSKVGISPPRGVEEKWKGYIKEFQSAVPTVDIRHTNNLTPNRFDKKDFSSGMARKDWQESNTIPGWGKTEGRFSEFMREAYSKT